MEEQKTHMASHTEAAEGCKAEGRPGEPTVTHTRRRRKRLPPSQERQPGRRGVCIPPGFQSSFLFAAALLKPMAPLISSLFPPTPWEKESAAFNPNAQTFAEGKLLAAPRQGSSGLLKLHAPAQSGFRHGGKQPHVASPAMMPSLLRLPAVGAFARLP